MATYISISIALATAFIGIIFDTSGTNTKIALLAMAIMSTFCALSLAVSSQREAAFNKRALANLVRAFVPSRVLGDAYFSLINQLAISNGFIHCRKTMVVPDDGRFRVAMLLSNDGGNKSALIFTSDNVANWCLLSEKERDQQIDEWVNGHLFQKDLDTNWNSICEFVCTIVAEFFPLTRHDGALHYYINADAHTISIEIKDHETSKLCLDANKLQALLNCSRLAASSHIISDIEAMSGMEAGS